ncbi:MAG: transposase [Bradyrhizobium sp.]|nr:transposase [Bradyrhizobium sp.]
MRHDTGEPGIQIDGIHIDQDLILLAAVGVDGNGDKHPLGVMEGASENAAVCQALIDNMVGRGLDPAVCRLFIIDGSRALAKAIYNSFGRSAPIQRCQVHKARNITERLPKSLHASARRALRQAWELDDADKAEKLIRNLARHLEREAPGRVGQHPRRDRRDPHRHASRPADRAASVACLLPNIIENMNGTIRRICRNVKRWRDAAMALRWTGAAMIEAAKGFRRLKAHKQLPSLRAALQAHQAKHAVSAGLDPVSEAA